MAPLLAFIGLSPTLIPGTRVSKRCRTSPLMTAQDTGNPASNGKPRFASNGNRNEGQLEPTRVGAHQSAPAGTVIFMAIANEFSMAPLYRRLLRDAAKYNIQPSAYGAVLRIARGTTDAFVFPYGCMVVWGSDEDSDELLELVVDDAFELRAAPAVDSMRWVLGGVGALRRDVITMEAGASDLEPALERLAISCGLAQSIKLGAFESSMRATIESTRHLPEQLAATGEITASRSDVSRLMGKLFLDRYRYHLSGDLLMTPAFFWEHEQYLPCYRRVERYLEVRERGEVLNKRVEVVQELYKLLGDELTHKNSMALELAITVMIAFEIVLTLITLGKESMRSMFSACALFVCLFVCGWGLWVVYKRRRAAVSLNKFSRVNHDHYR